MLCITQVTVVTFAAYFIYYQYIIHTYNILSRKRKKKCSIQDLWAFSNFTVITPEAFRPVTGYKLSLSTVIPVHSLASIKKAESVELPS